MKVFATDIDGTLTDETNLISLSALQALRKIEEEGVPVLLASGNALPVVKTLKRYLGCTGAIICENGSVIEYHETLKILGDREGVKLALEKLKDRYGDGIQEHWSNRYRFVDAALKRTLDREQIETVLSEIDDVRLVDSGFAYHITSEGVNKGEGLRAASQLMAVDLADTAAIGDSETDVELVREAGFKIALANAPSSLKQVADYVTKETNGEGVAEATDLILSKL